MSLPSPQVQLVRRPKSSRTGLGGIDDRASTNQLTASGGWDIVNDGSSSDGSNDDYEGGGGGGGDIYSFLFGPSSSSAAAAAMPTAAAGLGRRGYPRRAGDRSSGLGIDIAGGSTSMDMGMGGYLPLDLSYLAGLTGWPQQQQQRSNNADGWDDDDSNASR